MDLFAVMSGVKTTFDTLKLALDARDELQIKTATVEMTGKMSDLAMALLQAIDELHTAKANARELEGEKRELERKLKERDSYLLHEIGPGKFCYVFQAVGESATPTHYLCQPCYDKGIKSVLQFHPKGKYSSLHYTCPEGIGAHTIYP